MRFARESLLLIRNLYRDWTSQKLLQSVVKLTFNLSKKFDENRTNNFSSRINREDIVSLRSFLGHCTKFLTSWATILWSTWLSLYTIIGILHPYLFQQVFMIGYWERRLNAIERIIWRYQFCLGTRQISQFCSPWASCSFWLFEPQKELRRLFSVPGDVSGNFCISLSAIFEQISFIIYCKFEKFYDINVSIRKQYFLSC